MINLKQDEKGKIKESVKFQLANFVRKKGLTKKNNRIIDPEGLLKKFRLASEFVSICTYSNNDIDLKEYKDYFELEVSKASDEIINFYL
ncbi:hypothetical protein [Chryseobacterium sp. OSA05B]|uniref:hypothetical protein n=1 Tax=Chryseobacterium sp. OSA05B TaxID=2862650 RepID=UPI001CBCEE36|nr:hypothetical protein [Chryseobacterium sp. OSA05B]